MAGITKVFDTGVVANDDVHLAVQAGTIHAIVGENGAGKTTLMNVLYGRYRPDAGRIRVFGSDVEFRSPADAIRAGIGMVTQHSTFIPALTILDNVLLGNEPSTAGILRRGAAIGRLEELTAGLGVTLEWNARAGAMSVAALQKAEIVRALYRGAAILILDEPTAALAPQESEQLFSLLHELARSGHTIILITHNPNIPVLGEATAVYVLTSNGERSRLANQGSVDDCKTEIINLLEGGKEAFVRRKDRYNY